jgi:hypothetical protein
MRVLALDPGKTTGYANVTIDEDKNLQLGEFGQCKDMTMLELEPFFTKADVILYEGYWIRPDLARAGSFDWQGAPALEAIGAIMALAKRHQKPTVKQQPAQRVPGYAFAGLSYVKGKKGTHWQDALAHACFYAVSRQRANPVRSKKS